MAHDLDNVLMILLRRMDIKLDRVVEDVRDMKIRMTAMEEGLAGINRRMDRMDSRLESLSDWAPAGGPSRYT